MEKKKRPRISDDEKIARKRKLREELGKWQYPSEGGRRSLNEFAEEFGVSRSLASQWISEDIKHYPPDHQIEPLCEFFGLPKGAFSADGFLSDPLRQYEMPSKANELTENTISPYCELLGLDSGFLKAVQNLTDFDNLFPVWSPMVYDSKLIYKRKEPIEFAHEAAQNKLGLFQIVLSDDSTGEQKRVFLNRADLVFLKEMQDTVKSVIKSLCIKKRNEMEREVQQARRKAITLQSEKSICIRSLTDAEMRLIDKGLNAPTFTELKEAQTKDGWIDYNKDEPYGSFETPDEFEAWRNHILESK